MSERTETVATSTDILAIDDKPSNLRLLNNILTENGYKFRGVTDGQLGLDTVSAEPPQLILLDIRMPGMDGYQVCEHLKSDPETRNIPVIFLSATSETSDMVRAFEAGGIDFISKPFRPEEVLLRIRNHVALLQFRALIGEQKIQLEKEIEERIAMEKQLEESKLFLEKRVQDRTLELRRSETRFRLLFKQASDSILLCDDNLHIVECNDHICALTGHSRSELLRLHFYDLFVVDADRCLLGLSDAARDESSTIEYQLEDVDGGNNTLEASIGLIDISGITHYHLVLRDVTERKRAEAERERLIRAIEQAAESIIITDNTGRIEYTNPAFEETTGYTREEIEGENPRILNSGEQSQAFYDEMWQTLLRGETWRGQFANKKKDGSIYIEEATISPVQDDSGSTVSYISVQRDITREVELEKQLLQAQKMESLGTLAGGIAHDFNNVLQAIGGFSQVAQKSNDGNDEILSECLREIQSGCQRAADLVDQILTFSRVTSVEFQCIDLQPIVEEALRFLRSSIPSTVSMESKFDADSAQVMANATQIHQVVTNLCTNAMHAMEKEGGTLTVSLETISISSLSETLSGPVQPGDYIQLSVTDTGSGIKPEFIHRLLDPFFSTKEVGKGTGLGLAMIHGILKDMDGGLIIKSKVGKGTTVRVLFPVAQGHKELEKPKESKQRIVDGTGHVLIVDDEEAITKLSTLLLKKRGFSADAYNDVDNALQALRLSPTGYDVAILDYTMPKMTGIELATEFHSLNPDMPVILASGLLEQTLLDESRPPNVTESIRKPFSPDDLVAAVHRSLEREKPLVRTS